MINDQKNGLRKKYLELNKKFNFFQKKEWSNKICDHILNSKLFQDSECILLYFPLLHEVDIWNIFKSQVCDFSSKKNISKSDRFFEKGKKKYFKNKKNETAKPVRFCSEKIFCFPKVVGDNLEIFRVNPLTEDLNPRLTDFKKGAYGILEPKDSCEKISPEKIDLVLVPGICFDPSGFRVGFGKGYYDRFFASFDETKMRKIGVCFSHQISEENIPNESWDVPMDFLVSEDGLIDCR